MLLTQVASTTPDAPRAQLAVVLLGVLVTLAVSGVAGRLAFLRTARFVSRGWLGTTVSWWAAATAMLAVIAVATSEIVPRLHLAAGEAARVAAVTGVPAIMALAFAALVFGLLMADTTSHGVAASSADIVPRQAVSWVGLGVLAVFVARLHWDRTDIPFPDSVVDANRTLAAARAEARSRPHDARSQILLGMDLTFLKQYDEARSVLALATQLEPGNAHAHNVTGWMLNEERKFAEAIPHFERAVSLDPRYVIAYINLGWASLQLERWEPAERAYAKSVSMDPSDAHATATYAWILMRRDKSAEALTWGLRSLKQNPRDVSTHQLVASLYKEKANFAQAARHLERATELSPKDARTWYELGVTRYLLKDARGVDAAFSRAWQLDSTMAVYYPLLKPMWKEARQGRTGEVSWR